MYKISKEGLGEYRELFLLYDKDQNGGLSLEELGKAMKTLGQRLSSMHWLISSIVTSVAWTGDDLLSMVKDVSEDKVSHTIEFNEFLKMMVKQQEQEIPEKQLIEAFK